MEDVMTADVGATDLRPYNPVMKGFLGSGKTGALKQEGPSHSTSDPLKVCVRMVVLVSPDHLQTGGTHDLLPLKRADTYPLHSEGVCEWRGGGGLQVVD